MANYFCTDSVEEQVDYLTDKVTDLNTKKLDKAAIVQATGSGTDVVMSQKAVTDTINENLQTINTEIDGKLTKPANPSAESAVTMLADGTVGTKPLSEIGGGGKLYRHDVKIGYSDDSIYVYLVFYTTNSTLINTMDKIKANSNDDYVDCVYSGFDGGGSVYFQVNNATTFNLWGAIVARGQENVVSKVAHGITPTQITDTVTQL